MAQLAPPAIIRVHNVVGECFAIPKDSGLTLCPQRYSSNTNRQTKKGIAFDSFINPDPMKYPRDSGTLAINI
jgi:hypothetical protein